MAVHLNNRGQPPALVPLVQVEDPNDDNGGGRGCCSRIRSILLHPNTFVALLAASASALHGYHNIKSASILIESEIDKMWVKLACISKLSGLIKAEDIAPLLDTTDIDGSDACRLKLTPANSTAEFEDEIRRLETLGFPRSTGHEELDYESWANSDVSMRTIKRAEYFGTRYRGTWMPVDASIGLCEALVSHDPNIQAATRSYVTAAIQDVKPELEKLKQTFNATSFRSLIQRAENLVHRTFFGTFSTNLTKSSNNEKNQ